MVLETDDLEVAFGPAAGDRGSLSKAVLRTLDAIYRHPLSHNLEWSDVVTLFEKLGSVVQKSHNEMAFRMGGEHHLLHKSHGKDLTASEVMDVRHLLTRNGWSPHLPPPGAPAGPAANDTAKTREDLLVVMEHHEARLYHLEVGSADPADDVLRPYDPHHFLHHLAHKDQSRERGQRAAEDPAFYKSIAEAMAPCGRVVVIGHGKGQSNAAHHLIRYLEQHHPQTARKVAQEVVADLSAVTTAQLLVLGRRALTSATKAAETSDLAQVNSRRHPA